jgi:cytochrome P450
MVHPDVQRKLHNELDERVGGGRMPTMKEIEGLEYLQAAWSESMRWIAPVPIGNYQTYACDRKLTSIVGLPRSNSEEYVWNGYYIPKYSRIWINLG